MAGSTLGTILKVTTWGESHGKGIGVVVDGCPAGLPLSEEDIQAYLDRRKPGQSRFTTKRQEADREVYRPGHADYTFDEKYGFRDYRGGGRSSGRETIGRVAAGAIAARLLKSLGITVCAYTKAVGPYEADPAQFDPEEMYRNRLYMPDAGAAALAEAYLDRMMSECNSVGGVVECVIDGLPAAVGDPVLEKYDASLAKAILSIGAVKGFEIGDGFQAAKSVGSENNDAFRMDESGKIKISRSKAVTTRLSYRGPWWWWKRWRH